MLDIEKVTNIALWSKGCYLKTLPKAQRTRGLSSSFQSNLLGHITSSNRNLVQTSSSTSMRGRGVSIWDGFKLHLWKECSS